MDECSCCLSRSSVDITISLLLNASTDIKNKYLKDIDKIFNIQEFTVTSLSARNIGISQQCADFLERKFPKFLKFPYILQQHIIVKLIGNIKIHGIF